MSEDDSTDDRPGSTDEAASVMSIEPAERRALEAADIEPAVLSRTDCSYRMLLEAGVDEAVAASLRRRFSLPWSFGDETARDPAPDLTRRSVTVRGLRADERAWVSASATDEWQAFEGVSSRATDAETSRERPYPKPTPVTAVTGVSPETATRLADAGITSAERLATINASVVAAALDLSVLHVRTWRYNARQLVD